jgi:malonyl CoA-acyl carrier protein transacylase/thioesterase domain-containing protein/acyl carrier protein
VDVVQPVLFAVMVGLAGVWRSFGVEPAAVVGHSQGEVAAACVAGALSLPDAAKIIALRSKVMMAHSGGGAMMAVGLPAAELEQRLARLNGLVSIAAMNGPAAMTVGGEIAAIDELQAQLEADGVRFRRVRGATGAGHTAGVEVLRDELLAGLGELAPLATQTPFYSTVTASPQDTAELDAEYWYRNARHPVLFAPAISRMLRDGYSAFVECSPHPVFAGAIQDIADQAGTEVVTTGTLRRDDGGPGRFMLSAAELFVTGTPVDWTAAFTGQRDGQRDGQGAGQDGPQAAVQAGLPTYPFQRRRYWLAGAGAASRSGAAPSQAGAAPSQAGAAPGHGGAAPGHGGAAPGQVLPAMSPAPPGAGQASAAPWPADDQDGAAAPGPADDQDGPAALTARLAGLGAAGQDQLLLDLVRAQSAAVAGYPSGADIEPDSTFLELGFDSLSATRLRKGLEAATGLTLPAALAFDHPSPAALARGLRALLAGSGPGAAGQPADLLVRLYQQACADGRATDAMAMLEHAARLREAFDGSGPPDGVPDPLRLAEGSQAPALVCVTPYFVSVGAYQYARLAAPFRGRRPVWVLCHPGFAAGEPVPASMEALTRLHAQTALQCAAGAPIVLFGHSSGGWAAHAVAVGLEQAGSPAAGVIMADSFNWASRLNSGFFDLWMSQYARSQQAPGVTAEQLVAEGRYKRLFDEWDAPSITAPTVLLRPAQSLADALGSTSIGAPEHVAATIAVPGDHFTMLQEHAGATAAAIESWLESSVAPGPAS